VYGLGVDLFFFALTTLSFLILLVRDGRCNTRARPWLARRKYDCGERRAPRCVALVLFGEICRNGMGQKNANAEQRDRPDN
jgi:hypothetical protein